MNSSLGPNGGIIAGIFLLYGVFIVVGLASLVFWIIELIDVCRREFRDSNSKLLWILVVVLAHGLGALIYYFAGKPQGWLPGEKPLYPQYPQHPPYPPKAPPGANWPPPPGYYAPTAAPPEPTPEQYREE